MDPLIVVALLAGLPPFLVALGAFIASMVQIVQSQKLKDARLAGIAEGRQLEREDRRARQAAAPLPPPSATPVPDDDAADQVATLVLAQMLKAIAHRKE